MAVRDYLKVSRKTFFNPRAWLNYDEFKTQNIALFTILRSILVPPAAVPSTDETFEQVMARNNMTESDRLTSINYYRGFALLFTLLGMLAFSYAFFLLFAYFTLSGFLLAMCVCTLLLAQAFKYDFWSLQLRRRNLSITSRDWLNSFLGKKGGTA